MKKLLFVSSYRSPSVLRDYSILGNHFQTKSLFYPEVKKSLFSILQYSLQILKFVIWADLCFVRFADFRAFLVVLFCRLLKKKTAIAIGGYEVAKEPQFNYGALLTKGSEKRLKYIINNADIVIANSQFSRNEILKLNDRIEVEVVNHGVEKIQASESIQEKEQLIVTIGNLKKGIYQLKGIDVFAKAAKELGVKAMIIGDYENVIYEEIKHINPEIELTGYLQQSEIINILQKTKVYCQLSYRESFGVALLEAMSCGCIPVVTKNGALPEVVGDCGFYTDFGDVEGTVKAISNALKSNKMQSVIERVGSKFLLSKREETLLKIFRRNGWI